MTLLDAEQNVAEPPFTDKIEQFIQAAFFLQERLVAIVGETCFSHCHKRIFLKSFNGELTNKWI
jgi:hypothetical protein